MKSFKCIVAVIMSSVTRNVFYCTFLKSVESREFIIVISDTDSIGCSWWFWKPLAPIDEQYNLSSVKHAGNTCTSQTFVILSDEVFRLLVCWIQSVWVGDILNRSPYCTHWIDWNNVDTVFSLITECIFMFCCCLFICFFITPSPPTVFSYTSRQCPPNLFLYRQH